MVFKLNSVNFFLMWMLAGVALFSTDATSQSQHTTFTSVAPEELSDTFVRCFLKDSQGYMWFGTNEGLVRYDGINTYWYVHNPTDNKTIANNSINVIIEDSNQKLWIGTAQGLNNYDRETDSFINVNGIPENTNHLNNIYITALAFDDNNDLWIGTHGGGINIYDTSNFKFSYVNGYNANQNPRAENYISKLQLIDNKMWCGTKGGLKVFNTDGKEPAPLKFTNDGLTLLEITELIQDDFKNIFLATSSGEVIKVIQSGDSYSFKNILPKDSQYGLKLRGILALYADSKGNLWVGGENSGLIYIDTKQERAIYFGEESGNPNSLPTNSIRSVYIDNNGLTWIGTFNKGVYLIDNNTVRFDSYKLGDFTSVELAGKSIKGFIEDKNGDVWLACDGIGVIRWDSKTNELKRHDEINRHFDLKFITAMTFDKQGDLWAASWAEGIYKINLKTNRSKKYALKSGGFGDNKTYFLYVDKKGILWAGSNGSGLFYFDEVAQNFVLLSEENKPNYISKTSYVSSMVEDSDGYLWVGTMYGLYKLSRSTEGLYNYQLYRQDMDSQGFPSNNINCIYEDVNLDLWFGTTYSGLIFKPKQSNEFKVFQQKDGLISNTVRSISMDSMDNIWLGGNRGISKLNIQSYTFTTYDKFDGLTSNNFNGNASITTSKGKLFFGSNNGFNTFYPDSIQNHLDKPIVYLTDLKINNQSMGIGVPESPLSKHISLTSNLNLNYDQRSFTIDFVAINYGKASPYEYCYMLEGFDTSWNCISSGHSATYTNIDPGDYMFLVKASNSDGTWTNTSAPLYITIKQVWWKTWWAILTYLIIITAIVVFLFRIRIERMRMKNQVAMERLAREHEHELSESKTQFFTNISHEFRTPLSLIAMPLENLSSMEGLPLNVKERIGAIQSSSNKMMRLVNELMDFNKLENAKLKLQVQHGELIGFITNIANSFYDVSRKKEIRFGVHSTTNALNGWFDHDKLEKVVVNILSNAFKFTSRKGQININIDCKEATIGEHVSRCLELRIMDNGVGIPENELPFIFDKFYQAKSSLATASPGTGIGLSFAKGLVELHHGSIKVESKPNHETLFVIIIPIDKEIYSEDSVCEISDRNDSVPEDHNDRESVDYDVEKTNDKSRILLVEDNDELRKYLALELGSQFYVIEASDGQEGLEIALETSPDLIISDILMPVKSGIELCKDLKSNLKTSHIPFILLTAKATVDDKIIGIGTGADVYITKPFSIRFLLVQVNQIIESRKKLYAQFSKDVYLLPNKVAQNEIDQEFLQKAIDYIIENIQNPQLGVNSLSDIFNLSRMQVYRKIKALTGKSVVNFIRMVRIKQALQLMDTQKYTLAEIAYLTGFNSASYFTTSFKEEYGKAPSEYLEQHI